MSREKLVKPKILRRIVLPQKLKGKMIPQIDESCWFETTAWLVLWIIFEVGGLVHLFTIRILVESLCFLHLLLINLITSKKSEPCWSFFSYIL